MKKSGKASWTPIDSAGPTRVVSDVDYEKPGRQSTYLAVPAETNISAYGSVPIPIVLIRNGKGPTMVVTAGVHGDEYEGQIALLKLARSLRPEEVAGRIIILPALNLPAVLTSRRLSPIDDLNLNRSYPGDRTGSTTQTIAHYVASTILPLADIHVDLHSGGKTLEYVPCVNLNENHDPALRNPDLEARGMAAMLAFGAPIGLINRDLDTAGHPSHLYEKLGILSLGTELGGAGIVSLEALRIAERGVRNLLVHFGLVEGRVLMPDEEGDPPTRLVAIPDLEHYEMATATGIYEPVVALGEQVATGDLLGRIHFPETPDRQPEEIRARRSGLLLCKRGPGWVERGDNVAIVACDYE